MVGITPPRKLQTAGLFAYTPTPTIDDVMKVLEGRKRGRGKHWHHRARDAEGCRIGWSRSLARVRAHNPGWSKAAERNRPGDRVRAPPGTSWALSASRSGRAHIANETLRNCHRSPVGPPAVRLSDHLDLFQSGRDAPGGECLATPRGIGYLRGDLVASGADLRLARTASPEGPSSGRHIPCRNGRPIRSAHIAHQGSGAPLQGVPAQ